MYSHKTSAKIIAIIVVYKPDIVLLKKNIRKLSSQVNNVLIINNSEFIEPGSFESVYIINNNNNLGIATALNIGIDFAVKKKFDYALLLDQDSTPDDVLVQELERGFHFDHQIAMAVPQIIYLGTDKRDSNEFEYEFVDFAITSGSMLNLSLIKQIGYFDDNLFIDCVDFDYCFKIRINNLRIVRVNKAMLYQRLGNMVRYNFAGISVYPTNHNYIRRYYITRNRLYIGVKYFHFNKMFLIKNILRIIYEFLLIMIFERDRLKKISATKRAFLDFFAGKMGELKI